MTSQRTEASAEASSSPNSTTAANGASTAPIRIYRSLNAIVPPVLDGEELFVRGFPGGMRNEHVHAAVKSATACGAPRAVGRYIGLGVDQPRAF